MALYRLYSRFHRLFRTLHHCSFELVLSWTRCETCWNVLKINHFDTGWSVSWELPQKWRGGGGNEVKAKFFKPSSASYPYTPCTAAFVCQPPAGGCLVWCRGEMGGWAPFQSTQQTTTMLQEVSATLRCNHLIWCSGGGRSQSGAWFGSLPGRLRTLWLLLPSARRKWSKSGEKFWCFWCFIRVSSGGLFASPVSLAGVGFWNL